MREGGGDRRQNEMDGVREREKESQSFPEPVSLFITIMSVLLSPCPPTKISYSRWAGSYGHLAEWRAGLNAHLIRQVFGHCSEISQGSERAGGRRVDLVDPAQDGGKGSGRHVEDS